MPCQRRTDSALRRTGHRTLLEVEDKRLSYFFAYPHRLCPKVGPGLEVFGCGTSLLCPALAALALSCTNPVNMIMSYNPTFLP